MGNKCDGDVRLFIKNGNLTTELCEGHLANGGCLSTDKPINLTQFDILFLQRTNSGPDTPAFKVSSLTPSTENCEKPNKRHRYTYHVQIEAVKH